MIIVKTPARVSMFGGSTDYPTYLQKHPGIVVGGTINQYLYILCRYLPSFFEWKTHLTYSKVERVNKNSDIEHKAIRAVFEYLNITEGVEFTHMCDLPNKTGIGSSSAFIVGTLHALGTLNGGTYTPKQLYQNCVHIEQEILKENVGLQDAAWAAFGGINYIKFCNDSMKADVIPIPISQDNLEILEENLLLFVTGQKREGTANDITSTYVPKLLDQEKYLQNIYDIAKAAIKLLNDGKLDDIGVLLDLSWMAKRAISNNISTPLIDDIYETAKRNGALGGKLLGAGGGGNILLYVPKENQERLRSALKELVEIPFNFTKDGSKIILNTTKE